MATRKATEINADASASKTFFISMLTRDIDLADCMLDLLDNAVDGIRNLFKREHRRLPANDAYSGYAVEIKFDESRFLIKDESGGIAIDIAEHYAFRFGRADDAPALSRGAIGLYGIGMKRAIFKMGKKVHLRSSTGKESFELILDVDAWQRDHSKEWTFKLTNVKRGSTDVPIGTQIEIRGLYPQIAREFKNPHFRSSIARSIARDYAFILAHGLEVEVNGSKVDAKLPALRESAELKPFKHKETKDGVTIEIFAGMAEPPPDDVSATARYPEVETYGWYVVCNERVVVTADKSDLTGWGIKPVPAWHPQFAGFVGIARFDSADPTKLPWKTTKRDVESSASVYKDALITMMQATKRYTDYTNSRRAEAKRARKQESSAKPKTVGRVGRSSDFLFPTLSDEQLVSVEYVKPKSEVDAVAKALRIRGNSPSEVGIRTFDYFFEREVKP